MITPNELKNKNHLSFATENLSKGEYVYFCTFVSHVNRLMIEDFENISGYKNFRCVLNTISNRDYMINAKFDKFDKSKLFEGDPITKRRYIEGLDILEVRESCFKYFLRFGWEFKLEKQLEHQGSIFNLIAYFDPSKNYEMGYSDSGGVLYEADYYALHKNKSTGSLIPEVKSVKNNNMISLHTWDIDSDNYSNLEV